jgi:hypothetical protein
LGGVFRSLDKVESWTRVNNGLTDKWVQSLAVSGTTIFAGTGSGGAFWMADDGDNWTEVNDGLTDKDVQSLVVSGTTIFAGTKGGLWRRPLSEIETPAITTSSLPNGTKGVEYNQTLTATGRTPIIWSIEGGSLPNGLNLSAEGLISGTPTILGAFSFTLKASNPVGSDTKSLSIEISPATNINTKGTSTVRIYPNPVTNTFFVDAELMTAIKLYDLLGKEVLTQSANGKAEINAGYLPAGIYTVQIFSGNNVIWKSKIVKQ